MQVKQIVGKFIKGALKRLGYELRPLSGQYAALTMQAALSRRASSGLEIGTVIDVGASNGSWTRLAQQCFPDAFYFLIEANSFHAQSLSDFKRQNVNVDYILAAAGDSSGEIYFDATDPFGGLAAHARASANDIIVPVTTIDDQVQRRSLRPPFLVKLDTHGFEVPILKGAQETLKQASLLVVEAYNFTIAPDSLRFWEMCRYLERCGFRPIDLCDPLHRPKDQAFWQIDLFFVPIASREFESNVYG
jgi:FkbM family methyltransferase